MARHRNKRKLIKWLSPAVGFILVVMVVAWPSAVRDSIQEGEISNSIFGMTYRGRQPNGETFLLKAPAARETEAGHITFEKPSIETKEMNMQAATATLDVAASRIQCEGPVEISHDRVRIRTQKADLHLGQPKPADVQVPAVG